MVKVAVLDIPGRPTDRFHMYGKILSQIIPSNLAEEIVRFLHGLGEFFDGT